MKNKKSKEQPEYPVQKEMESVIIVTYNTMLLNLNKLLITAVAKKIKNGRFTK